jgi:hypothetical protein
MQFLPKLISPARTAALRAGSELSKWKRIPSTLMRSDASWVIVVSLLIYSQFMRPGRNCRVLQIYHFLRILFLNLGCLKYSMNWKKYVWGSNLFSQRHNHIIIEKQKSGCSKPENHPL